MTQARTEAGLLVHIADTIEIRQGDRPEIGPCWLWKGSCNNKGYGQTKYKNKTVTVMKITKRFLHGVVAPEGMLLRHLCRNQKHCVNPYHLRVGTVKENMEDKVRDGNSLKGIKHHQSKLRDHQVLDIYNRVLAGEQHAVLAREYGVHKGCISSIKRKKNWGWLTDEIDATFATLIEK